jgi:hypothetical protein
LRWLLLLALWVPICFVTAPSHPRAEEAPAPPEVCLAGALFAPVGSDANQPWLTLAMLIYAEDLHARYPAEIRSYPIGMPSGNSFAGVPWFTLAVSQLDEQERMIVLDPTAFLEKCLQHYDATVQNYSCTFMKHEKKITTKSGVYKRGEETIAVCFKQQPFSVYFNWLKGGDSVPRKTLFVAGENENKLVIPVFGLQDPQGQLARTRSRYPITQFGMRFGLQHILNSWRGTLEAKPPIGLAIKYLGKQTPPDDDQLCYKIESIRDEPEPPDGCVRAVTYISLKDLLLVRTEMYDRKGDLIASYHFKDLHLNRDFDTDQFQPTVLEGN